MRANALYFNSVYPELPFARVGRSQCPFRHACRVTATDARQSSTDSCQPDVPADESTACSTSTSLEYTVVNFYHLCPLATPGQTAKDHKAYITEQGWDIRGRIYMSYQGINAQFSGPTAAATAYTEWVSKQAEFEGVTWRMYPAARNMFPKLRLKCRPNLISLHGGMASLPVTGVFFHA